MVKVSIIVPVYNTENYLKQCLDSLVNQTLKDIEIIVVNDGSIDDSQKIIDEYIKKYPKFIKAYVKENGGLSDARNFGISKASGEYIGFVDSDDYVEITMFEKLYNKAISQNFDVVVCDINLVEGKEHKLITSLISNDIFNTKEIKKQMIDIYPAAWNKIYKRKLFEKVNFKKNIWYEDVEFLYKLFPYITSIGTVKEPLINYVKREGSITKTFDKRLYHYIDNFNGIVDFYKQNGFYEEYFNELEYCYVRYLLATFIKGCTNFPKKDFDIATKEALKNVKNNFPNYKKNPYLSSSKKGFYLKHFNIFLANILYRRANRCLKK